jgi:N6-adenosine-specific RNA methylase IME4
MQYDVIYADPAWPYYGSATKMAAAGKHYPLMSWEDLAAMPVRDVASKDAALFMWGTGPLLDRQIELIRQWGFHYRGVAWIWIKTRKDGAIIGGQGVPPTFVKPTTEFILAASTCKTGRPLPLLDSAMHQVILAPDPDLDELQANEAAIMQPGLVLAPRERHSKKPEIFRQLIEQLLGDRPRLELFARDKAEGWDQTGFDMDGVDYRTGRISP